MFTYEEYLNSPACEEYRAYLAAFEGSDSLRTATYMMQNTVGVCADTHITLQVARDLVRSEDEAFALTRRNS